MNQLDQIENRIKEIIEKGIDLFPWSDKKAILVSHFCEGLRHFLSESPDCLNSNISEMRIFMSPEEVKIWKSQSNWQSILNEAFIETLVELNCKPALTPELVLTARNSLQDGKIVFAVDEKPDNEQTGVIYQSRPLKSKKMDSESESGRVLINLSKSIPIKKSVINLGRKNTNDIVINDLRVSRFHAQIRKTREGYMIFDVGSTSGTFVNGTRIVSQLLKSGDVISLAGYSLIFTGDKENESESSKEITSDLAKSTGVNL